MAADVKEYMATRAYLPHAVIKDRAKQICWWADHFQRRPCSEKNPPGHGALVLPQGGSNWYMVVGRADATQGHVWARPIGSPSTVHVKVNYLEQAVVNFKEMLPVPWLASITHATESEWDECPLMQQIQSWKKSGVYSFSTRTFESPGAAQEARADFPNALGQTVETAEGTFRVVDVVYTNRNNTPVYCVRHPDGTKTWEKFNVFVLRGTCTEKGKIETPESLAYRRLQQFPQVPTGYTRSEWVNGLLRNFENGQKTSGFRRSHVDGYFFDEKVPWVDKDGILVGPDRTWHWLIDNATIQEAPRVR